MRNIIIRRVIVFSIWCMIISIGINFFNSNVWNIIRHMTPEETFILYPESFFIAIGILCILIGLTVITKNLWMRID